MHDLAKEILKRHREALKQLIAASEADLARVQDARRTVGDDEDEELELVEEQLESQIALGEWKDELDDWIEELEEE